MQRFAITTLGGEWLVAGSKSYGSQAGVGRVFSQELDRAMLFETREAAQAELERSFEPEERVPHRFGYAFVAQVVPQSI